AVFGVIVLEGEDVALVEGDAAVFVERLGDLGQVERLLRRQGGGTEQQAGECQRREFVHPMVLCNTGRRPPRSAAAAFRGFQLWRQILPGRGRPRSVSFGLSRVPQPFGPDAPVNKARNPASSRTSSKSGSVSSTIRSLYPCFRARRSRSRDRSRYCRR